MEEKITEESAKDIVNQLAIVIKSAYIHDVNNVAMITAIHKLLVFLNPVISLGKTTLTMTGEVFHLNEERVRYSIEYSSNFDFLIEEFRKRKLGAIFFKDIMLEEDIKVLVSAIKNSGSSITPFKTLSEKLEKAPHITIEKAREVKEDFEFISKKKLAKKTYSNVLAITKDVLSKMSSGETVNFRKSKRVIEMIADQIIEEESKTFLVGLTTIKDYDDYTFHHSVNVSILAMAFGHKLGLQKKALAVLGLAALYHDVGKIRIPLNVLNKTTELSDADWDMVRQHPIWGAVTIFKLKGINETSIALAIPSFEHHLNYDLSGYPSIKNRMPLEFYSNIIAIADRYDAMTSSRVYSRIPISPEKTLGLLLKDSGKNLDPHLLKIFIQMIGVYPVGCLVMLSTNELGLVYENNSSPDFIDRPKVLIITDSSGMKVKGAVVDLMEKDKEENFIRGITKTLDPHKYGINLSEYLL